MFKNLAGLGSLLRNAQQLGGQLKNLSEEMKRRRATGTAGGARSLEWNSLSGGQTRSRIRSPIPVVVPRSAPRSATSAATAASMRSAPATSPR